MLSKHIGSFLWDLFCVASIVGIWPRYVEPFLVLTTHLSIPLKNLPSDLNRFKILQISDLHFSQSTSEFFLEKILKKSHALKPDLIAFTGDFICYGRVEDKKRLITFLKKFNAPHGCFAVLGNHDYASFVSINQAGDYDVLNPSSSSLSQAFLRLTQSILPSGLSTEKAIHTSFNEELIDLLKETPFKLLHNETCTIQIKNTKLNISGFGEYCMKKLDIENGFKHFDPKYPGIILLHNPDGSPFFKGSPGNIILSGHTHGGQVNLPWMWKKFTLLENMNLKKGLVRIRDKYLYINRGLGSVLCFRWFAPPEMLLMTLENQ